MKQNKNREKLQNRKISPSLGSWKQLEKELDNHENKDQKDSGWFFKVASIALILISVGYFYLTIENDIDNTPVIAAPSVKENVIDPSQKNEIIESEVVNTNVISPIIENETGDSDIATSKIADVPSKESLDKGNTPTDNLIEIPINDSITGLIEIAEMPISEDQLIDEEVEELLRKSKIKLLVNGQISSKKMVSSEALLNSVEEDLYKDLKQKLIEKITTKLNNPKEVITSREN